MQAAPAADLQRQKILRGTVCAGLGALLFSRLAFNVADLDIWHEMSLIRASLAAGHLVTVDPFAFGPKLPLTVDHEWGAGAIAYVLAMNYGAAGILIFKYAVAASIAAFVWLAARARGASLESFSVIAPVAILFLGAAFSPIRGHMYSIWFAALLLWMLERDRRGERRWILWWLLLFPLWVNLHGGFVVGIGFVALDGIELALARRPFAHLLGVAAAMTAMVALNPWGFSYYPYLARALTMARPAIGEWRPVWDSLPGFTSGMFLLSVALVAYLGWTLGRLGLLKTAPGISLAAISAAEAALHQRMMPFFALTLACYVPAWMDQSPLGAAARVFRRSPTALQAVWTCVTVFFALAAIAYQPWRLRVPGDGRPDEMVYPAGAVDYLQRLHFHGKVMTPFESGAYASWRLFPAVQVSLDSRYEVAFPNWWVDESFRFYDARPGWEQTLAAYPADLILVRGSQPLAGRLAAHDQAAGWMRVYRDGAFQIFARPGLKMPIADHGDRVFDGRFP